MHPTLQVANKTGIGTMRGIFDSDAHVFSGFAIKKIFINVHVRVLVIGKVVVNQGLSIDVLCTRDPL